MTKKMISGLSKFQKIYTVEEHFSSTGIKSILSNELSKKILGSFQSIKKIYSYQS